MKGVDRAPTPVGAQRRLQALLNRSWSLPTIANVTGMRTPQLARALDNSATITPKLAAEIRTAYDLLWIAEPPRATQAERDLGDAARSRAEDCGWPPPLAWDDDQIDQPEGRPADGWRPDGRSIGRSADLAEDATFIRTAGGYQQATTREIARRLGVSRARLEKALSRQRSAGSRGRELEAG